MGHARDPEIENTMTTKKRSMQLAKRLDEVGFSDIVQIRNKVLDLRATGQIVHAFHGGEPAR